MTKMTFSAKKALFALFLLVLFQPSQAQQFASAGEYLDFLTSRHKAIMENFMSYTSAAAHNKSARKIESRRKELIQTVANSRKEIAAINGFNNDKALRDSTVSFLTMTYHVLNDDYGKIVDLEEVAEQSYDAMEAYFLAQDLADEKIDKANENMNMELKVFAEKNNINLISSDDDFGKKVKQVGRVNEYYRQLFLIRFKCQHQEGYMVEAMNKKDINAIEQNKNILAQYADENLKKLATIKSFDNDASLVNVCKQILMFYQNESKVQMNIMLDYFIKEDNFNKIKKAFEQKKESERTKADLDNYNKAVKDMNAAVSKFNATNKMLNEKRSDLSDSWSKTVSKFLDTHTPKYKK